MNKELSLSATQFGFAGGMFYVGYVLFELPSNLALRQFGARRWLARIMITWGIAAAGSALVTGPVSFYCIRALLGACEAGFYPGVIYYLSTWFPSEVRGRALAWFNVSNPLSSVVSGPLSASLLQLDGFKGLAGWRWLLICEGLPACVFGILILYLLPDRPREARWLSTEQQDALESRLAEEYQPGVTRDLWTALRHPRLLVMTASYFCLVVGVIGVALWLPQILKQRGLTMMQIGLASALPYLLAAVGMVIWSAEVDRTRKFLANHVIGCWVAAIGFALSVAFDSLPMMLAGFSLALIGMNSCRAPFFSLLPTFVQGTAAAGAIAVINSFGNLGGFVGPTMIGWLKDTTGSFTSGMYSLAGILALAGAIALLLPLCERAPGGRPESSR